MRAIKSPSSPLSGPLPSRRGVRSRRPTLIPRVATVPPPTTRTEGEEPSSSEPSPKRTEPLNVMINGEWYDLSGWRAAHPAGGHWIDFFKGLDAEEVVHAFHSEEAHRILQRLPKSKNPPPPGSIPGPTPMTLEFRELRARLIEEGWFKRDYLLEAAQLLSWAAMVASAVAMQHSGPGLLQSLAFLPLGISLCYAGWLAHDYIHGRGPFCSAMRNFGGMAAGFSATMWSLKHNQHHSLTNILGSDEDLSGGPLLYLWAPDPSRDKPWRPFQGVYVFFLFAFLHVIWRIDSVRTVLDQKLYKDEGLAIAAHYLIMFSLFSPSTVLLSILFGGWVMANITSTSHQVEDLKETYDHEWVKLQFETTRNSVTTNPFSEWLWGGMQYQIEHHLFPTMPRYRYPSLIPTIRDLAARHGVEYREANEWEMVFRNYRNYARVAAEEARPGAPAPKKGKTI